MLSQRSVCPFIPVNIFELHQLYVGLWTFHSVTSSHEHYFQNICQILPLSISSALALVNYTTTFLLDYCSVHYLISLCPFFIHSKPFFTNWKKKKKNLLKPWITSCASLLRILGETVTALSIYSILHGWHVASTYYDLHAYPMSHSGVPCFDHTGPLYFFDCAQIFTLQDLKTCFLFTGNSLALPAPWPWLNTTLTSKTDVSGCMSNTPGQWYHLCAKVSGVLCFGGRQQITRGCFSTPAAFF